jgi:hypothetical protein
MLQQHLDQYLRQTRPAGDERVVLRVRSAGLLARYGVGLRSFYNWFAGSHTMTVLEIDRIKPAALPDTVAEAIRLNQDTLMNYFRSLLHHPDNLCGEASS